MLLDGSRQFVQSRLIHAAPRLARIGRDGVNGHRQQPARRLFFGPFLGLVSLGNEGAQPFTQAASSAHPLSSFTLATAFNGAPSPFSSSAVNTL